MRRVIATGAIILGLQACATSYRPPSEPPPPQWTGLSGWETVAGSQMIHEGQHKQGDVLVEQTLKPRRTGTVVETVQTKSAYGKDFIIPKGTRVFAENFTLVTHGGWTGKKTTQAIDPIEWCAVLPNGIDGKQTGSETVCLFWETPTQARYMQDFRNGGFGYSPSWRDTSGVPGPVPQIDDSPVDLGVEIKAQLRLTRLDDKQAEIQNIMSDGTSERCTTRNRPGWWRGGKTLTYAEAGNRFELAASEDYQSVQFKRIATESAANQ